MILSKKELRKGNITIAEYLGERRRNLELDNSNGYHYHDDWSWIIPVVKKILYEDLEFKKESNYHKLLEKAIISLDLDLIWITVLNYINFKNNV